MVYTEEDIIHLPRSSSKGGYVYVIEADNGRIKIGQTANPYKRIQEIRNYANQFDTKLINIYITPPVPFYLDLEKEFHQRYAKHREVGEWFRDLYFHKVMVDLDITVKGKVLCEYSRLMEHIMDLGVYNA